MADPKYKEWVDSLRNFVYRSLQSIIPDDKERLLYVGDDEMKHWIKAFTHDTLVNDSRKNNDVLEFIGDKAINLCFTDYVTEMFKKSTMGSSHYTNLNSQYMSETSNFQGILAKRLGLMKYIVYNPVLQGVGPLKSIEKDSIEAFMGALFRVSDEIAAKKFKVKVSKGTGYHNCYNLLVFLMSEDKIDANIASRVPKQQIKQFFTKFKTSMKDDTEFNINEDSNPVTIALKPSQMEFLNRKLIEQGKNANIFQNPLLATIPYETDKQDAIDKAYETAVNELAKHGINVEWAKDVRDQMYLEATGVKEHVAATWQKIKRTELEKWAYNKTPTEKRDPVTKIYFRMPTKLNSYNRDLKGYIELIGETAKGNTKILSSLAFNLDKVPEKDDLNKLRNEVRGKLLSQYVNTR